MTPSRTWHYLRTTPIGELVSGSAHAAHPTDITTPLGVRFAGHTILALHVALEKAATVRVTFNRDGQPRLTGIRHIRQRNTSELVETLRSEARATRAEWVAVVFATGWQAVLGHRSARPETTEVVSDFSRHRLMFETPEVVVPRANVDRVYTAVDHPVLDKSVVFSLRRHDIEEIGGEIRKCGLGIAAIRIGVAAQLEAWLSAENETGLSRDLLITDGLSALLLNTEQGDFVLPRSAIEPEQPRQAVQRPSAIEEDIGRFMKANGPRSVTYIGPDELCAAVKRQAPEAEIIRPPHHPAHDTHTVALTAVVKHDLNFEVREVRPPLPFSYRRWGYIYAGIVAVLTVIIGVNVAYGLRSGYESYQAEKEAAQLTRETEADTTELGRLTQDVTDAAMLRNWVAANYHAQPLCFRILRDIPSNAAVDKLVLEMRDGQLTLTFVLLGDQETQLAAHRAVERTINELKYKIGGEDLPVIAAGSNRAVQYRMHIIVPDAAETTS